MVPAAPLRVPPLTFAAHFENLNVPAMGRVPVTDLVPNVLRSKAYHSRLLARNLFRLYGPADGSNYCLLLDSRSTVTIQTNYKP